MSFGMAAEGFVALIFMTGGVLCIVHARLMRRKIQRLRRYGQQASAVVVDYEYRSRNTPYPIVQFDGPDGRPVTAHTDFGGAFVPKRGARVNVLFDPEHPEQAHLDTGAADIANRIIGVIGWVIVVGLPVVAYSIVAMRY